MVSSKGSHLKQTNNELNDVDNGLNSSMMSIDGMKTSQMVTQNDI